jgi:predicted nucleotide-binding protein
MDTVKKKHKCFISSSSENLQTVLKLKSFLEDHSVVSTVWTEAFLPGLSILENLQNIVTNVDFVIVLYSSKENKLGFTSHDNLLLEIGMIMAMGKPLLILAEKSSSQFPTDFSGSMFLLYESNNIEPIFSHIDNWIRVLL